MIGTQSTRITALEREIVECKAAERMLMDALEKAERERDEANRVLKLAYAEMHHAYTFVKHREKMAEVGQDQYLGVMTAIREALKGGGGNE